MKAALDDLARVIDDLRDRAWDADAMTKAIALVDESTIADACTVRLLGDLGQVCEWHSRFAAAAALYERALTLAEGDLPDANLECLVIALSNAARIARVLGDFDRAEKLHQRAHAALASMPSNATNAELVFLVRNGWGMLCKFAARFDEAEAHYSRAFEIARARWHEDDLRLADLFHNLGGLEHARGRPVLAEPHARRAVEIRRKHLGDAHPLVARDLAALAPILDECEELDEAEAIYRDVLRIFESTHGSNHYEVAVALGNLGALLHRKRRFEEAERHFRRALEIESVLVGAESPDAAITLHNLATTLVAMGRREEARTHYTVASAIFERTVGAAHPHAVACAEDLAKLLATSAPT